MCKLLRPAVPGLFAAILLCAGTAAGAQDQVTIRIADLFGPQNPMAQPYGEALAAWQAKNPNVRIVREISVGDDQRAKLATDLAANNVADIFFNWTGPGQLDKFVDAGVALDMAEFFKVSQRLKPDHWTPSQLAAASKDGVVYQLPRSAFACFTLYNTALFSKYGQTPPTNWDELLAVGKVFIENGIIPINIGSKGGNPGHLFFNAVGFQLPNGFEDSEAAGMPPYKVDTDAIKAGARLITEMRINKLIPEDSVGNGDWPPSVVLYNQQRAAMLFTCPWMLPSIDLAVAEISELMSFPDVPGSVRSGKTFNIGVVNDTWMINRTSWEDPAKQEAIRGIIEDALLAPDVERAVVENGNFPAWNITPEETAMLKLPTLTAKVVAFTNLAPDLLKPMVNNMTTGGTLNAYLEAMDKLFAGQDADQVIADLQTTINREAQ
jgi:raffinose/stachyose/melibiose transport system substrate-binding protein